MVVEEITEGMKNLTVAGDAAASSAAAGGPEGHKRGSGGGNSNRIQVSNTKKPLFFYVNLAKVRKAPPPSLILPRTRIPDLLGLLKSLQRYMQQHGEVDLSALGMGAYLSHNPSSFFLLDGKRDLFLISLM
jgi:hypothetical protein